MIIVLNISVSLYKGRINTKLFSWTYVKFICLIVEKSFIRFTMLLFLLNYRYWQPRANESPEEYY